MTQITGLNLLVDRLNYDSDNKVLPVDDAFLKAHLQLDHSEDDGLVLGVGSYLDAARADVEKRGSVALIRQKRKQTLGVDVIEAGLDGQSISLYVGPVLSVTAVRYLDSAAATQTLSTSLYRLLPDNESIHFYGTMPTFLEGPGTVWVEYEAGFGDTADDVPADWKNLVCILASRKYDFRGGDSGATNQAFERMIERLVSVAGGNRRA